MSTTTSSNTLLRTEALSREFGGVHAVDGVSISLAPGAMHCIIGPNGAGKSTLLNLLCGTLMPSAGQIVFDGVSIAGLARQRIARLGIARKFQVPTVFESLTVADNLAVAAEGPAARSGAPSTAEVLRQTGLAPHADALAGHLPHGLKQWLEIGMALATGPRLLLLDEPTAGMTPDETAATADLLRTLAGRMTVLAIEHDIGFVRRLGGHTIAMHQGRVIAEGAFEAVAADTKVQDVYLGR